MDSALSSSADILLRNAELREKHDHLIDESYTRLNPDKKTVEEQNRIMKELFDWEAAPIKRIRDWFGVGELPIYPPQSIPEEKLPEILSLLVNKLYEKHIVLDHTEHLSDRVLYRVILLEILPMEEKYIEDTDRYQHWNFSFVSEDGIELDNPETWLAYYASDRDRKEWAGYFGETVPEKQIPRYYRDFPQDSSFSY